MPRLFEGNVDTQPNDDHSTDVFCTRSVLSRELQVFSRGRRGRAVTTGTHFQRLLTNLIFI